MAACKTVGFQPSHLELIETSSIDMDNVKAIANLEMYASAVNVSGSAVTFIVDGRILACIGFVDLWPGVCEVWAIPSIYVDKYPKLFHVEVKKYLEVTADTLGFHRVQTTAYDHPKFTRWLDVLGFTCEGKLEQYTYNKLNYKMWSRIFK